MSSADKPGQHRQATPKALRVIVATNVRGLARASGWSLAQLVDFAQVTRSALFRALSGDAAMTIDTLAKLAAALGVEPAQLVTSGEDTGRQPRSRRR